MSNLANKYRPTSLDSGDYVEQDLVVNIIKNMCTGELVNRNFLFIGSAGVGKAQPLTSKVFTPKGYKLMRDIKVGDIVVDGDGNLCTVRGVYPQGLRPVYRIHFKDRTHIEVSDEHINRVYNYNPNTKRNEYFNLKTLDLIGLMHINSFNPRVDLPVLNCWKSKKLNIDPYLIGVLIRGIFSPDTRTLNHGDINVLQRIDAALKPWELSLYPDLSTVDLSSGRNRSFRIRAASSTTGKYAVTYKDRTFSVSGLIHHLQSLGYPKFDFYTILNLGNSKASQVVKQYPELRDQIHVRDTTVDTEQAAAFWRELELLGVSAEAELRRVPESYLFASQEDRLALLQGLFDVGGYTYRWYTSNAELADDFEFLARSLGMQVTRSIKTDNTYMYKGERRPCKDRHNFYIHPKAEMLHFHSVAHYNRHVPNRYSPARGIVRIECIGIDECQCIQVDSPSQTYLTDNLTVTHNTTMARIVGKMLNGNSNSAIEIDAASHGNVDAVREIVKQAQTFPIGNNYKVFIIDEAHTISSAGWQALLATIEAMPARSVFIFCTTDPEKIPATILSRVQTFKLSKISTEGIYNRIKHVLDSEIKDGRNITYTDDAIMFIAKLANGGMRDALTLTDRALAYSSDISSDALVAALNLPAYDDYFTLLQSMVKKDNPSIINLIDSVYNSGINFVNWFESFHAFVINIVKYIFLQDVSKTLIPASYVNKLQMYGVNHALVCLKVAEVITNLIRELKITSYQQEMALTYLCRAKRGE